MKVLVLCTGNSARSILLESILNGISQGRIITFSAGSHPTGTVHPAAITKLDAENLPTDGVRSKSWDEFTKEDAPTMDVVITVCGNARDEECLYWPGAPVQAHWGVEDPAAVKDPSEAAHAAFAKAYAILRHRAEALLRLSFEDMPAKELHQNLKEIGLLHP